MTPPKIEVSIYLGDTLISRQILLPGDYLIGTGPEAQIRFPAAGLALRHARLAIDEGVCTVEDLGSVSGTFIDGDLLREPRTLAPGQALQIAANTLRLRWLEEEEAQALPRQGPAPRAAGKEVKSRGKYQIGRILARGGMGIILEAYERGTRRNVAMKIMSHRSRTADVDRFMREAEITARLEHPNIVPVHEVGVNSRQQPFYTMKLVRGTSLKDALDLLGLGDPEASKRYPLSALLTIFQKICDAVAFAHSKGVMHRDLKPENIMLGEYGEVLLMDWGLAKAAENAGHADRGENSSPAIASRPPEQKRSDVAEHSSLTETVISTPKGARAAEPEPAHAEEPVDLVLAETIRIAQGADLQEPPTFRRVESTHHGTVMGTPQYMSPEQARGEVARLDARTDIYALGAILYHILTLQAPFAGDAVDELLKEVGAGRFVSPAITVGARRLSHLPNGRVPASLAAVVMQAMALEPDRRYQQVVALQSEITAYQNGFATSAEQASALRLLMLFLRRHRTLSGAVVFCLIAGALFTLKVFREKNRALEATGIAQAAKRRATEQRDVAEDRLYLSHMLQAARHIRDGRPGSARELLDLHRREPSGRDLRDWEWYYSFGQLNQDSLRTAAHDSGVFALAASPDGSRLASAGGDGEIAIWQTAGLVPLFRLQALPRAVHAVAWDPDGELLAAGGEGGGVTVWNVATRQKIGEVDLPSSLAVQALTWAPKQKRLAIGGVFPELIYWNPVDDPHGKATESMPVSEHGIAALSWSKDGRWLALGTPGNNAQVINMQDGERRTIETGVGNDVYAVAIDPTSRYLAAGTKDRDITVFDLEEAHEVFSRALHRGFVGALAWSPDGQQLASASHDGTIQTFSPFGENPPLQILCGHIQEVNAILWMQIDLPSPGGHQGQAIFSAGADGTLRAWRPAAAQDSVLKLPDDQSGLLGAARWSPDGQRIAMVNFGYGVKVIDPDSKTSFLLPASPGGLFDVRWSPDGALLAVAARRTGFVDILEAKSGKMLAGFGLDLPESIAWSPSGKYLAAGGTMGVKIWDTRSGATLASINQSNGSLIWAPDEQRLILGGVDGAIQVWNPFTGKMVGEWREPHRGLAKTVSSTFEGAFQVFDLAWSPDRKWLAFVTQDGQAGLLDGESGRQVRTFTGHIGGIRKVAWSPDGRRLATCGQDGTLRIYNAQAGDQVAHVDHGTGEQEIHSVDWSPDGRRIITGGWDDMIRVWDESRGLQVAESEQLVMQELRGAPLDATSLDRLAQAYASLGWVDGARNAFARALALAPGSPEIRAKSEATEQMFLHALDRRNVEELHPSEGHWPNAHEVDLLNAIYESTARAHQADKDSNKPHEPDAAAVLAYETAIRTYRELSHLPDATTVLPLAQRYFSRLPWTVVFFPSKADPQADLEGWRRLSEKPNLALSTSTLAFPWLGQSPQDLKGGSLSGKGTLAADHCGMVAKASIDNLPAGKWRIQTEGDGGVRVLVDGRAVIEAWKPSEASVVNSGEFEESKAGTVEITVEHFAVKPAAGLEVLFSPVTGNP